MKVKKDKRTRIIIVNLKQILRELRKLDPKTDRLLKNEIKKSMRDSLYPMAKQSKRALKQQGSMVTGNLYRAITVKGRSYRSGYYSVALGARAKKYKDDDKVSERTKGLNKGWHLHFPNSGTKKRHHKSGHYTGKVPGKNSAFRIGFMDNVIKTNINSAALKLTRGLQLAVRNAHNRMNT